MSSPFQIRTIKTDDIGHIHAIQSRCYPASLHESIQTLHAKCEVSPHSCWLAEKDAQVLAYLITHPWHARSLPAFNQPLHALPADADTLFLHDLAIDPNGRGLGIAGALIRHAFEWATSRALEQARLIAVQGSQGFWQHHGFRAESSLSPDIHNKLVSYGADAAYLAYNLKPWQTSADASC